MDKWVRMRNTSTPTQLWSFACSTIDLALAERYCKLYLNGTTCLNRFDECRSPTTRSHAPSTYLTKDLVYSTGGVIGTPASSTALVRSMVAIMFDMIKKMLDSANALPGHTLRPNPNTASTW